MAWSVAVLDQGISNWFEQTYKRNFYEYDIYAWDTETDYGVSNTHGTYVAMSAYGVNPALDFIDLKIMSSTGNIYTYDAELALNRVISLSTQGHGIGAINLSWGGFYYPYSIINELNTLAARGIFAVAATGNSGSQYSFDTPAYPASLSNVIAVGAHDGAGVPAPWSHNHPNYITVLADGTDMPVAGSHGTSFAAPQVSATVASLQAYARYGMGRTLTLAEMKDALQQGGNGPRSAPDPANGTTRYFLHDHGGTVGYFVNRHLLTSFDPMSYLASHDDLMGAFGLDGQAALRHFLSSGAFEGRAATFDAWSYLAVNLDVANALGAAASAGATHYITNGRSEGRQGYFDSWGYLAANPDLIQPLGTSATVAARHYVEYGRHERRATSGFDAMRYIASYGDLITGFGVQNAQAAVRHFVSDGYREGRRVSFDGMVYLAANRDLAIAFGADTALATRHYIASGYREGRATRFDAYRYLASNADLIAAFGADTTAAAEHYVRYGAAEGRGMGFSAEDYMMANLDLALAFGTDMDRAIRHYVTFGWREARATRPDPATANVSEPTTDLPANATTTGRVAVGGTVTGRFTATAYASDTDWFRIRLLAGQSIQITVAGQPTGSNTLTNPYITVYNTLGRSVAYTSGTYGTTTTTLSYTATTAGDYHIAAQAYVYPPRWNQPTSPQPYTLAVAARRGAGSLLAAGDVSGPLAVAV